MAQQPRSDQDRRRARAAARGGGLKALAVPLAILLRPLAGRRGLAEGDLTARWEAVVGSHIARISLPRKLSFASRRSRTDGTLTLRVEPGHALALQHLAPQLMERINGHLGYAAVARLRFLQGPIAQPAEPASIAEAAVAPEEVERIARRLDGVDDADVREALRRLALARRRRDGRPTRIT